MGFDRLPLLFNKEFYIDSKQHQRQKSYLKLQEKLESFIKQFFGIPIETDAITSSKLINLYLSPEPGVSETNNKLYLEYRLKQLSLFTGEEITKVSTDEEAFLFYSFGIIANPDNEISFGFNILIDNRESPLAEINQLCNLHELYPSKAKFRDLLMFKVKSYCNKKNFSPN